MRREVPESAGRIRTGGAAGAPPPIAPVAEPRHVDGADADEVQGIADRVLPGMRIAPLAGAGLACSLDVVDSGPLRLMQAAWPSGAQVTALGERPILAIAVSGVAHHDHGGAHLYTVPDHWAALSVPGQPQSSLLPAGYRGRSVAIDRATLEAHVALVLGDGPRAPMRLPPQIDLTTGVGATLTPLIDLLWTAQRHAGDAPVLLAHLRDALLTALVAAPPAATAIPAHQAPAPSPSAVRRVEAYIDAHVREPIVLADLVAAAGVSARSLQVGFRAARGQSPMAFLKQRRLACARQDLVVAPPGMTVTAVARQLGFAAIGRFSVDYKRCFGESPSQTLARAPR